MATTQLDIPNFYQYELSQEEAMEMSVIRKTNPIILVLLAMMICILARPAMAAEENYRELPTQNNVRLDKANWTIQFTLPIDESTLNDDNIYIIKQENQTRHPVRFELSQDKKTIYIIPQKTYEFASNYRLFIEDGVSSNTNPAVGLIKKSVMTFMTIKEEKSAEISLNSTKYTIIDSTGTITGVENNTDVNILKSNITPAPGASIEVYQSDQTNLRNGMVDSGDLLIVTAQDGITRKTYEITLINTNSTGGGTIVQTLDSQTLDDLRVVSSGLEKAINQLDLPAEKEIASAIKNNIDNKIANPAFNHTAEINSIRSKYTALTQQQRENFQDAVLYNIPVQRLMRLAEYFGFQ